MKIFKNILFWVTTVCLVLAIAVIAVPKLFGVEFRAVVTGSMTPEIPVGSLVVIVPVKAEDIHVGDDITFVIQSGRAVTHRVVAIDREKNEFTTWGIANDPSATDAPNRYENIIGVVKLHIPVIGQIFSRVATLYGKIITATAIIAIYLLTFIIGLWTKNKKEPKPAFAPEKGLPADDSLKKNSHFTGLMASFAESEKLFGAAVTESLEEPSGDAGEPAPAAKQNESLEDFLKSDKTLKELLGNDERFKDLFEDGHKYENQ